MLSQHQVLGVEWARFVRRGLLADEPGLGKTRQAIEAFDGGRNLVVAPAIILDSGVWADELAKWSKYPQMWTTVSYTALNQRVKTRGSGTRPVAGLVKPEYAGPWDAVVIDEAHYIKSSKTNWTQSIVELSKKSDFALALTGTPISHWADDVFTTLQFVYPEHNYPGGLFGSRWRWIETWFNTKKSVFGGPNAKEIGGLKECDYHCTLLEAGEQCQHYDRFVYMNFGPKMLRRFAADCLDLPPISEIRITTPMELNQKRMYTEVAKQFATQTAEGHPIEAWSHGSQLHLLSKISTSAWLVGDKSSPPRGGKFEMLRHDLSQRDRPTLVFGHYRDTVEASAEVARSLGLVARTIHGGTSVDDRRRNAVDFKAGKIDVLCGSLDVLAEGLTLTQADTAIFMEKSYRPSRNKQARDRVYRWGQENHVFIREYITPNTIDAGKSRMLEKKLDHQMKFLSKAEIMSMISG